MDFQILPLDIDQFRPLFGRDDDCLRSVGVRRVVADSFPGYPCRVSLIDATPGETLLLMNYQHLDVNSPYRASHAIFVREWAEQAVLEKNEIPRQIRDRQISARAFSKDGMMLDASLTEGKLLVSSIHSLFRDQNVSFIHLHNAVRGCYAATVKRAE